MRASAASPTYPPATAFGRAAYGFARQWPATAKRVGFAEIAFGALTVAAVAAGVSFGI